jgi:hypothetical protein
MTDTLAKVLEAAAGLIPHVHDDPTPVIVLVRWGQNAAARLGLDPVGDDLVSIAALLTTPEGRREAKAKLETIVAELSNAQAPEQPAEQPAA